MPRQPQGTILPEGEGIGFLERKSMSINEIIVNIGVSALIAFAFSSRFSRKAKKPASRWKWFFVIWVILASLSFFAVNLP